MHEKFVICGIQHSCGILNRVPSRHSALRKFFRSTKVSLTATLLYDTTQSVYDSLRVAP